MILDCMLATGFGGLEKLFLDELEMLPPAGLDVRGVVRRGTQLVNYARDRGLPFDDIVALSDWDPFTLAQARGVVSRHNPDLIVCVGRKAHRTFARAVGSRIPIVTMVQKARFDRRLPYAGVLVAAEHRRRTLIADGVPAERIIVIPNAVRLPERPKRDFGIALNAPAKICGLGRLHEKKGYRVLIEALRRLTGHGTGFTCTIAGEGPEREALEKQVAGANLAQQIALPGWTDNVASFLLGADIFVLPSFQEDFPLAVLDAMSCGVPIVASRIDGPKDFLLDGETALIVPPNDPTALEDALNRLIANPSLRKKLGTNARRVAEENYGFPAIGRRLAAALNNVIAGRPIAAAA
jgi:glycosyltransferase involved in cell wall biosynthesis